LDFVPDDGAKALPLKLSLGRKYPKMKLSNKPPTITSVGYG